MQDKIKIVILAGGKGVRMESPDPKALTKFKEKPFIEHILNTITSLNLSTKPTIVVGYKKERIKEVLGEDHEYAVQAEQLGTGHALMTATNTMSGGHKVVIVISADQPVISKETLEQMLKVHQEKNPTITIGSVVLPDFNEWRIGMNSFGRIIRGEDGLVKKIIEFKDATPEEKNITEVNPALYIFDSEWLLENIDKLKNENAQKEYLLTDLIKIACEQNKKIEAVPVANIIEGLQPNSKAELEILEKLVK